MCTEEDRAATHAATPGIHWLILLLADMSLIWGAYLLYAYNAWYRGYLQPPTMLILGMVAVVYTAITTINHIRSRENPDLSSAHGYVFFSVVTRVFFRCLKPLPYADAPLFVSPAEKTRFLFLLVKLFFIPVMLQFSVGNYRDFVQEVRRVVDYEGTQHVFSVFNNIVFPVAVTACFLLDTLLFCFGYLVSASRLRNQIKSVDPTWSGWVVTLACYPPFNNVVSSLAPHHGSTYAYFYSEELTFLMRLAVLLLLFIYVSASVSLGPKCSNLTNRGIVHGGTYRFVRHPAYISKVLAWWLLLLPVLTKLPLAAVGMVVWTAIYFLRAVTEERHLMQDPDYVVYCAKVKYRFIPWVY